MKTITITAPKGKIINKALFDETGRVEFIDEPTKYPKSVEEIEGRHYLIRSNGQIIHNLGNNHNPNYLSSEKRAEAFLALMQLVELRDACNKIDGGVEFEYEAFNYTIEIYGGRVCRNVYADKYKILHFRKESTRDLFLDMHKDLIEQAKELL